MKKVSSLVFSLALVISAFWYVAPASAATEYCSYTFNPPNSNPPTTEFCRQTFAECETQRSQAIASRRGPACAARQVPDPATPTPTPRVTPTPSAVTPPTTTPPKRYCFETYNVNSPIECFNSQLECTNAWEVSGESASECAEVSVPSSGNGTITGGQYQLLQPIQDGEGNTLPVDLPGYLRGMFQILISLAAVLAVLMIIYGGILYMSSDAIFQKSEGKAIIKRAVWGLILVIGSVIILISINPAIIEDRLGLSLGGLKNEQGDSLSIANWCLDVFVAYGSDRVYHSKDCSAGPSKNLCEKDKTDYYNGTTIFGSSGREVGFSIGKSCYDRVKNNLPMALRDYCIDIHLDNGLPFKVGDNADCTAGKTYKLSEDRLNDCRVRATYHEQVLKNTIVNGKRCYISNEGENRDKYCNDYQQPGKSEIYTDCSTGSAYMIDPVTVQECSALEETWRSRRGRFSPSQCYNDNETVVDEEGETID